MRRALRKRREARRGHSHRCRGPRSPHDDVRRRLRRKPPGDFGLAVHEFCSIWRAPYFLAGHTNLCRSTFLAHYELAMRDAMEARGAVGQVGSKISTAVGHHGCSLTRLPSDQPADRDQSASKYALGSAPIASLIGCGIALAMPNNCCVNSTVIASAAKQSRGHSTRPLDCFVARAPRNDGQWWCSRSPSRLSYFWASP
jgi:hypothetical protein